MVNAPTQPPDTRQCPLRLSSLFNTTPFLLEFQGGPAASIDFEAGRFFERADSRGTLDETEFQRLWRAARTGEPMQPPTKPAPAPAPAPTPLSDWGAAPPPTDLPLPAQFDAGVRFERFDRSARTNHRFFFLMAWADGQFLGGGLHVAPATMTDLSPEPSMRHWWGSGSDTKTLASPQVFSTCMTATEMGSSRAATFYFSCDARAQVCPSNSKAGCMVGSFVQ